MSYVDELDYGREMPGRVCPECGGSVVLRQNRPWCDWDGEYVVPVREQQLPVIGAYDE